MMSNENNRLALDLFRELAINNTNLFFSPYSIKTALAMTYAGAQGNTAKQMAAVLHFTDAIALHTAIAKLEFRLKTINNQGHIQLNVANAMWPQEKYPFLNEFCDLLETYYKVTLSPLDYKKPEEARNTINQWIEEKTIGKIKNLIPSGALGPLTTLVLTNAIYFKGDWAMQFNPQLTEEAAFFLVNGDKISVQLMYQEQISNYGRIKDLQIIEIPYQNDDLSMIIILPDQPDRIEGLINEITVENLVRWLPVLKPKLVDVFLPKFSLESDLNLSDTLIEMGMSDAFDSEKADFSGMDGIKWLYISSIFHKAYIGVNEEGSEAAAATAVILKARGFPIEAPPVFRADHPFIFLIREKETGSILFMGKVLNPNDN